MPKTKTDDPRSKMTDHTKYMTRSLHTVRIVTLVVTKLIDDSNKSLGATAAVRRACEFLGLPTTYSAAVDPTMAKCVENVREQMKMAE